MFFFYSEKQAQKRETARKGELFKHVFCKIDGSSRPVPYTRSSESAVLKGDEEPLGSGTFYGVWVVEHPYGEPPLEVEIEEE